MSIMQVTDFMAKNELCVISTINKSHTPESAIVGFTHDENCALFIGTSRKSRKYANLTQVPNVAIVIGGQEAEIQYEGTAEIIASGAYRDLVEQKHIKKLPGAAEYRDDPSQVYVKITPSWIRFLRHGNNGSVEEFTEFSK